MTKYILDAAQLDAMEDIEHRSFSLPWNGNDIDCVARNEAGNLRTLGVYESNVLCGWGCVALLGEEAHVLTLSIAPEHRGKGFGRELVQALVQACADAGARFVELECRRNNIIAQNLYKSLGFIRVGVQPGYYTDTHEDALIYALIVLPAAHPENDPYLSVAEDE